MFEPRRYDATPEHTRIYGLYEKAYTTVDLVAALLFLIGSILFFYNSLQYYGTWMFVIGSLCFAAKPAVRFAREFHLGQLPLPGDERSRAK